MSDGSVLLVNYNGGEALLSCLQSLRASDAGECPVLLVDNGSEDGSVAQVRSRHPEVEVWSMGGNVGFAAAVNRGLEKLQSRGVATVLLLNPDTEVAPDFYAPLQRAVAEGAALAGPKLLLPGPEQRLWCAGGSVTFGLNLSQLRGHRERDRGRYDTAEDMSFLPGTAWLVPQTTWQSVGLLDERFFCYVEDVDYCLRIAAAGGRIRYEPASRVVHHGSAASGGGYTRLRKYLNALGSVYLMRKHGSPRRWLRFVLADVFTLPLALVYGLMQGRPGAAFWKLRGLWDGLWGRSFGPKRRRQLLTRERVA